MRETIQCHLNDSMVFGGKVGLTFTPRDDESYEEGYCDVCEKPLKYVKDFLLYPILAVACRDCRQDWIPKIEIQPIADVREKCIVTNSATETCPDCGGLRRGRGFTHARDCPGLQKNQEQVKPVDTCEKCSGPRRGRGFRHKNDCPIVVERQKVAVKRSTSRVRHLRL